MEALGGDCHWFDRFVAQHCAVAYFWLVVVLYMVSPSAAYRFGQLVEMHAGDTYGQFLEENEALLRSLPPPRVAVEYYRGTCMALFGALLCLLVTRVGCHRALTDAFHTTGMGTRRPQCHTLYDVFCNIRDDELEHVATMQALSGGDIAD